MRARLSEESAVLSQHIRSCISLKTVPRESLKQLNEAPGLLTNVFGLWFVRPCIRRDMWSLESVENGQRLRLMKGGLTVRIVAPTIPKDNTDSTVKARFTGLTFLHLVAIQ